MQNTLEPDAHRNLDDLRAAAESVRKCSDIATPPAPFTDDEIATFGLADARLGGIVVDQNGLSQAFRSELFTRTRSYLEPLFQAKLDFVDRFQPYQTTLDTYQSIPATIAKIERERDEKIAEERVRLENDRIWEEYFRTKSKYDDQVERHSSLPKLQTKSTWFPLGVNPWYAMALTLIGMAEWFINYDTLFLFFGVPIISIGSTFVLAAALAFIAHQHGEDLKQWKRKFGPGVERKNRPYGVLILATVGLIGLLIVVGWMRYQSLYSVMQVQPKANILGTDLSIRIDPVREVVISLGANLIAWLVGVFISYFAHDPDPVYVANAMDFKRAEIRYVRRKARFDRAADQLKHRYAELVDEERNRSRKFESDLVLSEARSLREQVSQHEQSFAERARAFLITQASRYRIKIGEILLNTPQIKLFLNDGNRAEELSSADYQGLPNNFMDDLSVLNPANSFRGAGTPA
jgi:hypothetical protein